MPTLPPVSKPFYPAASLPSTPAGNALFQMLGVFAGFERSIIQDRISAGIARARQKGTKSGRAFGRQSSRQSGRRLYGPPEDGAAVGTGNATVARIAAEMQAGVGVDQVSS